MPIPVRCEPSLNVKGSRAGGEPQPSWKVLVSSIRENGAAEEGNGWRYQPRKETGGKVWGGPEGERSAATVVLAAAPGAHGACPTRGVWSPGYTRACTRTHTLHPTHTHTPRLCTCGSDYDTGKGDRRSGLSCGKDAWGLRGVRAALPAPSARTRASTRLLQLRESPSPAPRSRSRGGTRRLEPLPG